MLDAKLLKGWGGVGHVNVPCKWHTCWMLRYSRVLTCGYIDTYNNCVCIYIYFFYHSDSDHFHVNLFFLVV